MILNIFLFILTLFFRDEESFDYSKYLDEKPLHTYRISDKNILLSYSDGADIYNIETRQRNTLEKCTNCVYGYDGEIVRCEYEHRQIESIEEYSTSISVYDSSNDLLSTYDIFPTVTPFVCTKRYVLLKSAYPFLEQNTYILYLDTGELKLFGY